MRPPVIAAILLLTACKSTEAFMQGPPYETLLAKGSPQVVARCIGEPGNVYIDARPDGSFVIKVPTIYGGSGQAWTIHSEGAGTAVEYRKAKGLPIMGKEPWRKCLD